MSSIRILFDQVAGLGSDGKSTALALQIVAACDGQRAQLHAAKVCTSQWACVNWEVYDHCECGIVRRTACDARMSQGRRYQMKSLRLPRTATDLLYMFKTLRLAEDKAATDLPRSYHPHLHSGLCSAHRWDFRCPIHGG